MLSWSATSRCTRSALRRLFQASSSLALDDHEHVLALGERRRAPRAAVLVEGASPSTRPLTTWIAAVAGPVGEGAAQGGGLHLLGGALVVVARRAGRGPRHRRRTAARGSSPDGPGRCPSGGTACGHRRGPRRGVLVECVPWRAAASWATTTWWISGMLTCTSKISAGSSTVPDFVAGRRRGRRWCSSVAVRPPSPRCGPGRGRPSEPGTAPLMSSRPFSASTAWTVRFWVVTCSPPIRPAIRMPLKTRPGVAQPPMEPGLRWLRCAPWRGADAVEAVALHDAGEALALAGAGDVDALARPRTARR